MTFKNITSKEQYANCKKAGCFRFENVPNTAVGFERCRCFITLNNVHKYFLSANNEKDYFLEYENPENKLFIFFSIDNDNITIKKVSENGRIYTAERYLKRYTALLATISSCIKYDEIIEYKKYV